MSSNHKKLLSERPESIKAALQTIKLNEQTFLIRQQPHYARQRYQEKFCEQVDKQLEINLIK